MRRKTLLQRLKGETTKKKPVWLMRQAGRYLPEYRSLRNGPESFIDFCLTPKKAAEATLQPIRRFGFDGAILFADILLVPYGFGISVEFEEGEGPRLKKTTCERDLAALVWNRDMIAPVFETIDRAKSELPEDTTFLGFAGGMWTVACYMMSGRAKRGFEEAVKEALADTAFFSFLMNDLEEATLDYLSGQIEAGVEAVQIFESHAGLLQKEDFKKWVVQPTKRLVAALKERHPDIPVIGYPRGAEFGDLEAFMRGTGVDVVSLDPLMDRRRILGLETGKTLQGNLDPALLLSGGAEMEEEIKRIQNDWGDHHVFNLGHGILPQTPLEHVERLIERARS